MKLFLSLLFLFIPAFAQAERQESAKPEAAPIVVSAEAVKEIEPLRQKARIAALEAELAQRNYDDALLGIIESAGVPRGRVNQYNITPAQGGGLLLTPRPPPTPEQKAEVKPNGKQ